MIKPNTIENDKVLDVYQADGAISAIHTEGLDATITKVRENKFTVSATNLVAVNHLVYKDKNKDGLELRLGDDVEFETEPKKEKGRVRITAILVNRNGKFVSAICQVIDINSR